MILLTILSIVFILLVAVAILCASIGGTLFLIVFGDLIVCALVIAWIIKKIINRKNKKK